MKITNRLKKALTEWAEAYLEHEYEHNCWLFKDDAEIVYRGQEIQFTFEGICNSSYAPEEHYLEGQYCGDTGGETTVQSIEVVDIQVYDSENDNYIKIN